MDRRATDNKVNGHAQPAGPADGDAGSTPTLAEDFDAIHQITTQSMLDDVDTLKEVVALFQEMSPRGRSSALAWLAVRYHDELHSYAEFIGDGDDDED